MTTKYKEIIEDNLTLLFQDLPENLSLLLPAEQEGNRFYFKAFGQDCCLGPEEIRLSGQIEEGPKALLISLYALHIKPDDIQIEPLKAFKDLPGSMPYHGPFTVNSERILIPFVSRIQKNKAEIGNRFEGGKTAVQVSGDFSMRLFPLPKIMLCYIFYLEDEEFPASATCLFSANAQTFMPLDGLADVGEYTSRSIIDLLNKIPS